MYNDSVNCATLGFFLRQACYVMNLLMGIKSDYVQVFIFLYTKQTVTGFHCFLIHLQATSAPSGYTKFPNVSE